MSKIDVLWELPGEIAMGCAPLGILRVRLSSTAPTGDRVSARLNLWEGDVALHVVDPGGVERRIFGPGSPPDTEMRMAEILPGQQLSAVLNLTDTSVGYLFSAPGEYSLRVEYRPGSNQPVVESLPARIVARAPATDVERGIASVLVEASVRVTDAGRALMFAQPNGTPGVRAALGDLADRFSHTPEGTLAALLLAAVPPRRPWAGAYPNGIVPAEADTADQEPQRNVSEILDSAAARPEITPTTLALWATALETPFNPLRGELGYAFAEWASPPSDASADSSNAYTTASCIALFQPVA